MTTRGRIPTPFDTMTLRLKQETNVALDKQLAALLGMKQAAWSARKKRNSFPETAVRALAQRCPDLALDVDYIFSGSRRPDASTTNPAKASMREEQKHHSPLDLRNGLRIETSAGAIEIWANEGGGVRIQVESLLARPSAEDRPIASPKLSQAQAAAVFNGLFNSKKRK